MPQFVAGVLIVMFALAGHAMPALATGSDARGVAQTTSAADPLEDAQREFYNGRYDEAERLTAPLCSHTQAALAACELRSSTLLFEMKKAIGKATDKDAAWSRCERCPALMVDFRAATSVGQVAARERIRTQPRDDEARFFLGKIDLNYVWLELGVLGHKTGWDAYWEARHLLDAVLKSNPNHTRARVARAWIDYIVDTEMPRGTKWLLGGGNRKRGLRVVADAAGATGAPFVRAEAAFALWDMQVREGNAAAATITARELSRDFPGNEELSRFLVAHGGAVEE